MSRVTKMRNHVSAFLALAALLLPAIASAYIGPGPGLSAIGSLLALVGAVLLAIVGFVWYPIRRLLRRDRNGKGGAPPTGEAGGEETPDTRRK